MNAFTDFDEAGFVALAPSTPKPLVDIRLSFVSFRSGASKLQISLRREVLDEIGGPRFDIAWNAAKRNILLKSRAQGPFEAASAPRGKTLMLRMPIPSGLVETTLVVEPEYYVDAIGKRILIEVPDEFGRRLALPAPKPATSVVAAPLSREPIVSQKEIEAGNREILRALGVTRQFPTNLGGVKFAPAEARMLEVLYRGQELTLEALLAATHDPEAGDDDRDVKIVDVWLCKMRPRLAELDIVVKTIWGGRRSMDAASKARLRDLLKSADVPA